MNIDYLDPHELEILALVEGAYGVLHSPQGQWHIRVRSLAEALPARFGPLLARVRLCLEECRGLEGHPAHDALLCAAAKLEDALADPLATAAQWIGPQVEVTEIGAPADRATLDAPAEDSPVCVEELLSLDADEDELEEQELAEERRLWLDGCVALIKETIAAAADFFDASDLALYVRDNRAVLEEAGVLRQIVEQLIEHINSMGRIGYSPLKMVGSPGFTLDKMVNFALKQRFGGTNGRSAPQRKRLALPLAPYTYPNLAGKVVVFGGHQRLASRVRRLLPQTLELVWLSADASDGEVRSRSDAVATADVVFLVKRHCSHKCSALAESACLQHGKRLNELETSGVGSTLEAIALALKLRSLQDQMGRPKR